VIFHLKEHGVNLDIYDPCAIPQEVHEEYQIEIFNEPNKLSKKYHAIILAVAHNEFLIHRNWRDLLFENGVLYDVKSVLPREIVDGRL
jgi:UDP-N-acetyl-D-galactosamine dehydrogenase